MLCSLSVVLLLALSSALADKDCSKNVVDVGFIIDSSGSLRAEYHKEKKFVTDIAETIGISETGSHAGVITFSYFAKLSIKLNEHVTTDSFSKAAQAIPLMGYTTRIDLAFRLAQSDFFTSENGGRDGVKKILILLTDGTQTKAKDAVDPAFVADDIRKTGVMVVVIGIGIGIDNEELDHIAGGSGKAYVADSFDQLIGEEFVKTILGSICSPRISTEQTCPPDVPVVNCVADPCAVSMCKSNPQAMCMANYCGDCNAKWFDAEGNVVDCNVEDQQEMSEGDKGMMDVKIKDDQWRTMTIGFSSWPEHVCPPGIPVVNCAVDPCSTSSCQSNPKATCKANYCGSCNAEWYDENGDNVDCGKERMERKDEKKDMARNTGEDGCQDKMSNCGSDYVKKNCKLKFVYEKCKKTCRKCGPEKNVCEDTSSACGSEYMKKNCKLRFVYEKCRKTCERCGEDDDCEDKINTCSSEYIKRNCHLEYVFKKCPKTCRKCGKDSCAARRANIKSMPGVFTPSCKADGSYEEIQCHGSTGYCWCVNEDGKEITGTRKGPGMGEPNCNSCAARRANMKSMPGVFTPSCKADGSYEEIQCHGSTGYCWCVNEDGKEITGTRKGPGMGEPNCNSCAARRANIQPMPGVFIPSCKPDGSYEKKQCHGSTGYCWCVNEDGKEITGTRTGPGIGELICDNKKGCPPGVHMAMCAADPCSVSSCPSNPKATCKANYCGGCNAEWFDENGNKVVDCNENAQKVNLAKIDLGQNVVTRKAVARKATRKAAVKHMVKDNRVCWRHISPGCVNGHNLLRLRNTTVEECKQFCVDHPDCKSVEYGVPHGGSRDHYRPGDCQLNSGSNAKNCDGVKNNLDLYVKIDCKHNVCWKKSSPACARAHNIRRVKDLSLEECKRLCAKTEGCVGFEYGVNHGGSRKHYRPRDCQLNTWKNIKGCDGKHNNLDFYAMKDCETTCYKHVSPGCVRGHNIRRIRNKSVAQCKSLCAITPRCVGFEYGVNHGGARKHYRVGDCQLNTYTRTDNCDAKYNNLDFYLMYDCARGHSDEHDFQDW